jgi:polysaccharide export outer membrane protein
VWVSELPKPAIAETAKLRVGDKIQVAIHGQDAMSGEFEIRQTGDLILPQIGQVPARGLLLDQLRVHIEQRLIGTLQNPRVSVGLVARRAPFVSVLGEVTNPGRYELRDNEGVLDALARAGGFSPFADKSRLFVLSKRHKGQRIRFRYEDLIRADPASVEYELLDGDVLIVE